MKLICNGLLLLAITAVGCTPLTRERVPDAPAKKSAGKGDAPPPVAKLLPEKELTPENADAQAKIFYDTLMKEKGKVEKTESARRE